MSATSLSPEKNSRFLIIVHQLFVYGIIAYPVAYLCCISESLSSLKSGKSLNALYFSMGPLAYLALLAVLFLYVAAAAQLQRRRHD